MEYLGYGIPLIVIGLMELLKNVGLNKRLIPFVNIALTIAIFTIYVYPENLKQGIFVAVVASLSSMGLFNATKSTINAINTTAEVASRRKKPF
jgi:hypothetical protein